MSYRRYYVSTLGGKAVKPVLCDCGCAFVYEIHRSGAGTADVGLLTNDGEARDAAREFAAQSLESKLKSEIELVPCPRCGLYQPDMVRAMRERRFHWALYLGGVLVVTGLLVSLIDFIRHRKVSFLAAFFWRRGMFLWLAGAAVCGLTQWLSKSFDPNRDAAQRAGKCPATVREIPKDQYRALLENLEKASVDLG